jgi:ABC-type uncharacterized transport system permease subunit
MSWLRRLLPDDVTPVVASLLAVVASLCLGAIVIVAVGENPFAAYYELIRGAIGDVDAITSTMARQVPMLLTGLAWVVAFQAGLISLGSEGQLYMGGLAVGIAGYMIELPSVIMIPYLILIGALAGGLYGLLAGWLRTAFKIPELLSTLMMNYIAIFFTAYMAVGPFRDRSPSANMLPKTQRIVESADLPTLIAGTRLHLGFFIAVALTALMWWFLVRTRRGYEFRMHGFNPAFAEYAGIDRTKLVHQAMFMSGGVAGIAGAIEVMGVHYRFIDQFSPGYGFDGIAAAILGNSTPVGTFFSSLFFSALRTGAMGMDRNTHVPFELRNVVQAMIIFFIASNLFVNYPALWKRLTTWWKRDKTQAGKGGQSKDGSAA